MVSIETIRTKAESWLGKEFNDETRAGGPGNAGEG